MLQNIVMMSSLCVNINNKVYLVHKITEVYLTVNCSLSHRLAGFAFSVDKLCYRSSQKTR